MRLIIDPRRLSISTRSLLGHVVVSDVILTPMCCTALVSFLPYFCTLGTWRSYSFHVCFNSLKSFVEPQISLAGS